MSGLPEREWRLRFREKEVLLTWEGHKVVNPAESIIARNPWIYRLVGYRMTLAYDLWLLKHCTHIHMVGDDWQQSRGARLERLKARRFGIQELKS